MVSKNIEILVFSNVDLTNKELMESVNVEKDILRIVA